MMEETAEEDEGRPLKLVKCAKDVKIGEAWRALQLLKRFQLVASILYFLRCSCFVVL